jgi:acetylornithine/N-succinyldiaminopimelate aminotransferase
MLTSIGTNVIRMVPPLIASKEECDKAYEIIKASVEEL